MTTSGVTSFSVTRDEIIRLAFEDLGIYAPGFQTPTAGQVDTANKRLNMMIKAWQAAGIGLWLYKLCTLPLKAGAQSYLLGPSGDNCTLSDSMGETTVLTGAVAGAGTISVTAITGMVSGQYIGIQLDNGTIQWTTINGTPSGHAVALAAVLTASAAAGNVVFFYTTRLPRPVDVVEARSRTIDEVELPLTKISRDEYMSMPLKSSTGPTVQYYYDPQTTNGRMFVWQVETVLSTRIVFTGRIPIQDFVYTDNTPDFPQEWFDALHFNLAWRMAPAYKIDAKQYGMLKEQAGVTLADANDFDREQGTTLRFAVDFTGH